MDGDLQPPYHREKKNYTTTIRKAKGKKERKIYYIKTNGK